MLNMLFSYGREAVIATMALLLYIAYANIQAKETENELLKSKATRLEYTIVQQNAHMAEQKKEYETKLKQLPKEITKIKTKYEVIYKNIKASTGDKNASCEDTINTINNFHF